MGDSDSSGGRTRRRRALQPEEKALWQYVTASVRPMRPQALPVAEDTPPAPAVPPDEKPAPVRVSAALAKIKPSIPAPPPLAPLEPKLRRRLSRGGEVDARLDLHGLTQAAAHGRLASFLRSAQGSGYSLVLVITGKGKEGRDAVLSGEGGRGVLRRLVPQWLSAPDMRAVVVGFEPAARGHGGEGALYVRIRRIRSEGR